MGKKFDDTIKNMKKGRLSRSLSISLKGLDEIITAYKRAFNSCYIFANIMWPYDNGTPTPNRLVSFHHQLKSFQTKKDSGIQCNAIAGEEIVGHIDAIFKDGNKDCIVEMKSTNTMAHST
jgi:hypothetical protein